MCQNNVLNWPAIVVAHNIGITIYEAKITSIEDRLKGYTKPPLLGVKLLMKIINFYRLAKLSFDSDIFNRRRLKSA